MDDFDEPNKRGPKGYDKEHCLPVIYARVAAGQSLDKVLREDSNLPSATTFWRWHMEDEDIRDNLARARENGVEALMDESISIADDKSDDYEEDENGKEKYNPESVARAKLRVETRFKYAQMIAPRKYGPKLDVTSGGEKTTIGEVEKLTRLAAIVSQLQERADAPDNTE